MNYAFSNKVNNLKPSAIREIFKYASDPSVISLSAGNPSPDAFPYEKISDIINDIFNNDPISALQYSITEGYSPLRNLIKSYMCSKHNIGKEFDDIIITSGAQQVMDLSAKSLCNEDDTIICESPSFIGSLNTFRSYNLNLYGIPMQNDGMDIEKLENAIMSNNNIKFIYTIPNFQNPSGITMSFEKRKLLYNLAKKHNILILEDNPYGDLRYSGTDIPSIKSLDEDGIVIYAGTFSKVLSPGLRIGFSIAPKDIIQKMVVCKQGQDVHTNILAQMITYQFIKKYDFSEHIKNLQQLYKKKAELTVSLLEKYMMPKIKYNKINGGLFIWCTLPNDINMLDFCKEAISRKVCVVPGNAFLTDENEISHSFRINFSTPTEKDLYRGIKILGNLVNELIE